MQAALELRIREDLRFLYGAANAERAWRQIQALVAGFRAQQPFTQSQRSPAWPPDEREAILICYPDQVQEPGKPPLQTLAEFLAPRLEGVINGLHLLPFYPASSDDGFAVVDYHQVDPRLGSWADVRRLGGSFRLMFDAVINHVSSQSAWVQGFLAGDPRYADYFIEIEGDPDLSGVVRPRTSPLLTSFARPGGEARLWTTFSADQVDLNYRNPAVLFAVLAALLFYASQGATYLRLDAVAYLWKQVGTPCIHLPQTHAVIRLFRAVLDLVAPHVVLVTETNVPHAENIAYFGAGEDEAQMVYNFALPPLVLHSLYSADASRLTAWVAGLRTPGERTALFNFLASHDGVGLNPVQGILPPAEIEALVSGVVARRGLVSYKQGLDGAPAPYELNVSYFDALGDPGESEPGAAQVDRFVLAHAILLALAGVPGVYFHSLFGSRGWPEGVALRGAQRAINRQKLARQALERELDQAQSLRSQVAERLLALLRLRAAHPAFHPAGTQVVLKFHRSIFALQRTSPEGGEQVICLHNLSTKPVRLGFGLAAIGGRAALDLVSGEPFPDDQNSIELRPYQFRWLKLQS